MGGGALESFWRGERPRAVGHFTGATRERGNVMNAKIAAMVAACGLCSLVAGQECTWDNGEWDGVDGQTSERDTAVEDSRTADDFCLKDGYVYEICSITVQMLTSANAEDRDVELTLYHDCDGCPAEQVDCGFFIDPEISVLQAGVRDGLDLIEVTFNTKSRIIIDEYGEETEQDALWLKGGCYWVSPVGIGDGTEYDRYFWGTAGEDLLAAKAKSQAGPFKVHGWERVDELNVDCRNFAFDIEANKCCIVRDNGAADETSEGAHDTTGVDCRNADNFAISPCVDSTDLCFFSAYIYTNCDCDRTKLEIHADDCGEVGERVGDYFLASKCVQLSGFGSSDGGVDFEGQELALYRVEFHNPGLSLEGGANYWASLHVQGTGSFNERGFWAYNYLCENAECDIHLSSGQWQCPQDGQYWFEESGRDHAFCIATTEASPDAAASGCAADYNGDGRASVADLLTFLDVWFEGCEN